ALDLRSNRASVWSMLFTATLAALLIGGAALLPRRRLAGGPRWPLAIYCSTIVLAIAGTAPMVVYRGLVPRGIESSLTGATHPGMVGTWQLALALLYILAALGFTRRHRLTDDELSGWLAIG